MHRRDLPLREPSIYIYIYVCARQEAIFQERHFVLFNVQSDKFLVIIENCTSVEDNHAFIVYNLLYYIQRSVTTLLKKKNFQYYNNTYY